MLIHIQDDIVRLWHNGLLDRILKDKTTKKNIMWATDAYAHFGHDYERNEEIQPHLITGANSDIIKTRARKEFEQQNQRTRKRAEVFTPMWICRMMNDRLDEEWFGYPNVFFKEDEPTSEIRFFEQKHTWQDYVDSRRLEITCGEAPYLMSRYDVATGELVPVEKRCGILDRKLRVVSKNTTNEDEWFSWAVRALQATYGYEFQGDNVLIARINMLCTFEDYLEQKWQRSLTRKEQEKLINIITWNIWQMDGLTYTIPFRKAQAEFEQLSLFNDIIEEKTEEQPLSRVYDWRADKSGTFEGIKKGENRMKFDFIIGNPPYNQEAQKTSTSDDPIYNYFMDNSYIISDRVLLITPARFLMNAGKTPAKWNEKMLNDPHVRVVLYESNSSNVFPTTDIPGGICITYRDSTKNYGAIKQFISFPELNEIDKKVKKFCEHTLDTIIYSQSKYSLDDLYSELPEMREKIGSNGKDKRFRQIVFERFPDLFVNECKEESIRVLGLYKRKRTYRYIKRKYVEIQYWTDKYKVFVPFSNGASGTLGTEPARMISKPEIGYPGDGITQTFIGIGAFDTKQEAENLLKYILSKFCRVLLGIMKVTQGNKKETWLHVPIQDFTSDSDIDWSKSIAEIDRQLYTKYGLDEKEIEFIETHVKEME